MNKGQQKLEIQFFCSSNEQAEKFNFYFSQNSLMEFTENKKASIAILFETQVEKIRSTYERCLRENYSAENIVLVAPQNSLPHRTFSIETNCSLFLYDTDEKLQELPIFLNTLWQKLAASIISKEIEQAYCSGALAMLSGFLNITYEGQAERARFAGALAISMSYDIEFTKRTIKLALFHEITSSSAWTQIAKNTKEFWCIEKLLSEYADLKKCQTKILPANTSEEIILVEVSNLLCSSEAANEQEFYSKLRDCTALLPFKIKTNLRMSAEKTFARVWEKKNVAA